VEREATRTLILAETGSFVMIQHFVVILTLDGEGWPVYIKCLKIEELGLVYHLNIFHYHAQPSMQ
jgi:hypothetical protein